MATSKAEKYSVDDLKSWLVTNQYTVMDAVSVTGNKTASATFTKDGYFPLCIAGFYINNGSSNPTRMYISSRSVGSVTINVGVKSHWDATSVTFRVDILWLKVV